MGIPQLWDVIKDEDLVVSISKLAEDFFKEHGRPIRIAVDEADWVHNNVTPEQVKDFRQKSKKPNRGIEKNIFWRICYMLSLNIQLLFVSDSPQRPPKRSRRHYTKLDPANDIVLKETLDAFGIPRHQAKGEAEAECTRLQQLGIVDAVWSQDSDCLMFGCDFLLHDNRVATNSTANRAKGHTKKDKSTCKVVRGADIQQKHGLNRDGLLLFAMLCGGDFNPGGLKNCGMGLAVRAVRDGVGQGLSLCQTKDDCLKVGSRFCLWLTKQKTSRNIDVPLAFPELQTLNKYNKPAVNSDVKLIGLRGRCERPINEPDLLTVTCRYFNLGGKRYLDWVGPILLTRWLVRRDPSLPWEHAHRIELVSQRAANRAEEASEPLPTTLECRFSAFELTSLDKRYLEKEWQDPDPPTRQKAFQFDPEYRVEKPIPAYLLQRFLQSNSLHSASKTPRKRAIPENYATVPAQKKLRTTNIAPAPQSAVIDSEFSRDNYQDDHINLESDSEDDSLLDPGLSPSALIDQILASSNAKDEDKQVRQAISLSLELPVHVRRTPLHPRSRHCKNGIDFKAKSTVINRADGLEMCNPQRQITSNQTSGTNRAPQRNSSSIEMAMKGPSSKVQPRGKSSEIIDLTV